MEPLEIDLASPQGTDLVARTEARHGSWLRGAAARFSRLFLLRSPWAPGLRFVGGVVEAVGAQTLNLSGTGEDLLDALASCLGEGIERLSQVERDGDISISLSWPQRPSTVPAGLAAQVSALLMAGSREGAPSLDWVAGRRLADGAHVSLPADWCLRRDPARVALPQRTALSTGVAAGPDADAAAARAVLELIERDAAALWWIGGRRAAPLALECDGAREATRLLQVLRKGATRRSTWLLDITSDVDVPVLAALSCDADGKGLACGLGCRLDAAAAVRAAILELCQMELALLLARAKARREAAVALPAGDVAALERAERIDVTTCALLHPAGAPRRHPPRDPGACRDLERLRERAGDLAIDAALADLSRGEHGLSVVAALAPALQPLPAGICTQRLDMAITETGGGERWTGGLALV